MEAIENALYLLSTLFFYPVIVGLLLLLAKSFIDLGTFMRDWWRRRQRPTYVVDCYRARMEKLPADTSAFDRELALQGLLESAEKKTQQPIAAARYAVKMGPTLGLIGTLTPMARALSGLAGGDMASLSSQMITAFSTTVIGLVVGGIAFSMAHIRSKWQMDDLYQLSELAERALNGRARHKKN